MSLVLENPPKLRHRKRHGRCYELCLTAVLRYPEWRLVHGWVDAPNARGVAGGRMAHAWMLRDNEVFDQVLNKAFFRLQYTLAVNAKAEAIYTADQVNEMICQFGHWGPWP